MKRPARLHWTIEGGIGLMVPFAHLVADGDTASAATRLSDDKTGPVWLFRYVAGVWEAVEPWTPEGVRAMIQASSCQVCMDAFTRPSFVARELELAVDALRRSAV